MLEARGRKKSKLTMSEALKVYDWLKVLPREKVWPSAASLAAQCSRELEIVVTEHNLLGLCKKSGVKLSFADQREGASGRSPSALAWDRIKETEEQVKKITDTLENHTKALLALQNELGEMRKILT